MVGLPDPASTDAAMGDLVRRHRKAAGFSQEELAKRAGISPQQLQKYESGKNRVSVQRLFGLAHVLGQEPANLVMELQNALGWKQGAVVSARTAELDFIASPAGRRIVSTLTELENEAFSKSVADLIATATDLQRPGIS